MFEDNFENRFRSNGRTLITRSILGCGTMEMGGMSLEIFAKYGKFGGITGEKTRGKKKGGRENGLSETVSIFQYRERQISPVDFFLSRIIPVSNAYSLSSYRFDATSCFVHPVDPIVSDRIIKKKKKMKENQGKRRKKIEK